MLSLCKTMNNKNMIYSKREKYISEVISSKENAIRFLLSVGIIDKDGRLTSVYK